VRVLLWRSCLRSCGSITAEGILGDILRVVDWVGVRVRVV